jgi:hypothetical protein
MFYQHCIVPFEGVETDLRLRISCVKHDPAFRRFRSSTKVWNERLCDHLLTISDG